MQTLYLVNNYGLKPQSENSYILIIYMKLSQIMKINPWVSNFYIHIPFCVKKCYFCAFPIHAAGAHTEEEQKNKMYEEYCSKLE